MVAPFEVEWISTSTCCDCGTWRPYWIHTISLLTPRGKDNYGQILKFFIAPWSLITLDTALAALRVQWSLTRFERACGVEGWLVGTTNTASSKRMGHGDWERHIAKSTRHNRTTVYVARFCIRRIGSLSTLRVRQHYEPAKLSNQNCEGLWNYCNAWMYQRL